ncbi:RagB/SusD family nutrient uptake outer membrane protein [Mucilaginibacter sp. McL0603]|uniref:RagB/SusD family nutrient uptake outer membrane protein n=1 Tax=Mucilaginibacter sp. McL0603 TaxID=3415670 RepID=UPI003CE76413
MKTRYNLSKNIYIVTLLFMTLLVSSCKKEWLDAKPNLALVVPSTVKDYQAILDNNTGTTLFNNNQPALSEVGAGDLYLLYPTWQALDNTQERNAYLWNPDIYAGETAYDWNDTYNRILNENIVLDGIAKVPSDQTSIAGWNNVKGTALFYRAYDFWSLAQEFAKAYDPNTASSDLGIPIRTNPDITVKSVRATVQQTYDLIVNDLLLAKTLLPDAALFPTRPGKAAVYGMLSRAYMSMSSYDKAFLYADSCLQLSSQLLNYNSLSTTSSKPIARFNKEVIYHHTLEYYSAFTNASPNLIVDSVLYNSYSANDLRKRIFFKDVSGFKTRKASYGGASIPFGGIATDEIYLIRAECYARKNDMASAMKDLNTLLFTRWLTGTFVPYTAANSTEALLQILAERRKELVYRGLRWSDLKRLNKDTQTAVTLTRTLNSKSYSLAPNSNLYVFPIPPAEVQLSGLPQNPR